MIQFKNLISFFILTGSIICVAGSDDFVTLFERIRYNAHLELPHSKMMDLEFLHDVKKLTFKRYEENKQKLENCDSFYVLEADGQERPTIVFFLHDGRVNSVAFSHNEQFIASAGVGKKIKIWSVQTQSFVNEIECESPILLLSFIYNDQQIIALHEDKTVRIWDIRSKRFHLIDNNIQKIAFSGDGKMCACIQSWTECNLWNLETNVIHKKFSISAASGNWTDSINTSNLVALNYDGQLLATFGNLWGRYTYIYPVRVGDMRGAFNYSQLPYKDYMGVVATSIKYTLSEKIISNHSDGRVILLDPTTCDFRVFDDGNAFYSVPTWDSSITACSLNEDVVITCHQYRDPREFKSSILWDMWRSGIIKIWNLNTKKRWDLSGVKLLREVIELGHVYPLAITANASGSMVAVALTKNV